MKKTTAHPKDHPALASAKTAIRRTLVHLTPVQLLRLASTAEVLAYGEARSTFAYSVDACDGAAQPYQIAGEPRTCGGTKKGGG